MSRLLLSMWHRAFLKQWEKVSGVLVVIAEAGRPGENSLRSWGEMIGSFT